MYSNYADPICPPVNTVSDLLPPQKAFPPFTVLRSTTSRRVPTFLLTTLVGKALPIAALNMNVYVFVFPLQYRDQI